MFSKTALLQATNEFLILGVVVEFKSFGFSCVVVGQQYSLNFILVSYFHFEMFGSMTEIFLLADICVFSLCRFCQPIFSLFEFSNKIIILNLCRSFLIKMNVLKRL